METTGQIITVSTSLEEMRRLEVCLGVGHNKMKTHLSPIGHHCQADVVQPSKHENASCKAGLIMPGSERKIWPSEVTDSSRLQDRLSGTGVDLKR